MMKYITKRAVYSIIIVLILGFIVYMLTLSAYGFEDGIYLRSWRVQWNDTDYFYKPDYESRCFSPVYFIPVQVEYAVPQGYIMDAVKITFDDTSPKFYASPFSRKHIIARSGTSKMFFTLYKTEKAVMQ